ncbi:hypothetical protein BDV93DRAFT_527930 [Ceratobasidium sp. AG-I]|nr:hypothetical protein BDV93DRAFT_527930 [Ceratobasidium sp. AG-I]
MVAALKRLFLALVSLSFGSMTIAAALAIVFWFTLRDRRKLMQWQILFGSLIEGLVMSCTQELEASIATSIRREI